MSHHSYVEITVIRIFRMLSDISSICYGEADHLGKYFMRESCRERLALSLKLINSNFFHHE